jgi:hypothetical protein
MARTFASLTTAAALMISSASATFAQGTNEQREACTPDAFRLCATAMPDERRVESCLRAAGPRLSRACYNVFYPPTAEVPPQAMRGQGMQPSAPDRMQPPPMRQMPPRGMDDDDDQ